MATVYLQEQVSDRLKALAKQQKRSIATTLHILIDREEIRMMKIKNRIQSQKVEL